VFISLNALHPDKPMISNYHYNNRLCCKAAQAFYVIQPIALPLSRLLFVSETVRNDSQLPCECRTASTRLEKLKRGSRFADI
jgi:hypothetical protein